MGKHKFVSYFLRLFSVETVDTNQIHDKVHISKCIGIMSTIMKYNSFITFDLPTSSAYKLQIFLLWSEGHSQNFKSDESYC